MLNRSTPLAGIRGHGWCAPADWQNRFSEEPGAARDSQWAAPACLKTLHDGYNLKEEPRDAVQTHRPSKPSVESSAMSTLKWERRPGAMPCMYATTDARWMIWPADHHSGWELFEMTDGPELIEWHQTVTDAKAHAERLSSSSREG